MKFELELIGCDYLYDFLSWSIVLYPTAFISSGCLCIFYWFILHCLLQAVIQSIEAVYTFLTSLKEGPDRLAISTIAIDFLSLIIGEFGRWPNPIYLFQATLYLCICFQLLDVCACCIEGRRRSWVSFLKVYMVASTAATLLWIACVAKSNFTLKVRKLNFLECCLSLRH